MTIADDPVPVRARLRILWHFGRPVRWRLLASVALAVLATVLELVPFLVIYQAAVLLVSGQASVARLHWLALCGVGAALGRAVIWGAAATVSHLAAFDAQAALRERLAEHLERLPLGWFAGRRIGEIKKALAEDVERIELLLAHAVPEIVSAAAGWLIVTGWLLALDWRMLLAVAAVVPCAYVIMRLALRRTAQRMAAADQASAAMNGAILETINGMPVLKIFDRAEVLGHTQAAIDAYVAGEVATGRAYFRLGTTYQVLVVANLVVALPIGLLLQRFSLLDSQTLLLFLTVGLGYSLPLLRVFRLGVALVYGTAAAVLVDDVLRTPGLPGPSTRARLAEPDVEYRNVRFGYAGRTVLDGISFHVPAGTITAVVGPSGAGKTTLARLLPRFWDVDSGTVAIGGVDVRAMPVAQLMETVTVVFQDAFLFDDTVRANIAMGNPAAAQEEVVAAAVAAQADGFIRGLPAGYDTIVGERGARLSAGERQRITIARALLKAAPVLVLDEATAFADPESEAAIQDAISILAAGRTVLVIAHRLSTVVDVDNIVVLDRGRVVDQGGHRELVSRSGVYQRLWHAQEASHHSAVPRSERIAP